MVYFVGRITKSHNPMLHGKSNEGTDKLVVRLYFPFLILDGDFWKLVCDGFSANNFLSSDDRLISPVGYCWDAFFTGKVNPKDLGIKSFSILLE